MGTPLSDPRKTKVIAVQDSRDIGVIHIYGTNDVWIASLDDASFMNLFGEWAHAAIYHSEHGSSKVELELFIVASQR